MLAPNTDNYIIGKGRLYFKKTGSGGFRDLGNVPKFELKPEVTKVDHFSSRSGTKVKDKTIVSETKFTASFDLEEFSLENLDNVFLGDEVHTANQSKTNVSGAAIAISEDNFLDLGKVNISSVKITHGTVTSGPFVVGAILTGATSAATGTIGWVGSGFVELFNVTGTFSSTESVTSSGGKSATATSAEVRQDIIVTDAASPTVRYVQGTDYDVDVVGGLLRARASGAISTTAYVSYDAAAATVSNVRVLANTSCEGQLLFIGDPDEGPKLKVEAWNCQLTVGGTVGLISDTYGSISMSVDILADSTNHPSEPYAKITEIV